eukprot:1395331-Amorphochlora_amoeboformis.AAC.1
MVRSPHVHEQIGLNVPHVKFMICKHPQEYEVSPHSKSLAWQPYELQHRQGVTQLPRSRLIERIFEPEKRTIQYIQCRDWEDIGIVGGYRAGDGAGKGAG